MTLERRRCPSFSFFLALINDCLSNFSLQSKPIIADPIDFEGFILKNKTLIQNDPQRELLMYPNDDVTVMKVDLFARSRERDGLINGLASSRPTFASVGTNLLSSDLRKSLCRASSER